ncbi:MAG: hypothetical protein KDI50_06025 [Candidatus Competibacteraceae bacterium]|nr:hypothetical protein [Candidatus Competibacteraceae bacterium]
MKKSHPKTEKALRNLQTHLEQYDQPGTLEMLASDANPKMYVSQAVFCALVALCLPELRAKLDQHFNGQPDAQSLLPSGNDE